MTAFGGFSVPGMGTLAETTEYEIIFGGERGQGQVLEQNGNYRGEMRDAGNTPTTVIRAGLLMGKTTSGGELQEWAATATDGTENIFGIVPYELRAQDFDATDQDRVAGIIVRAPLKAAQLLIEGTNLVGDTDEFLARRQLHAMGCILDDDTNGNLAGAGGRFITDSTVSRSITAAENGTTFFFTNTSANIAVTLPSVSTAPPVGLEYWIIRGANSADDFLIQSADGDDVIVGNDLTADSVTWTTTGEEIGAGIHIRSVYLGSARRWYFDLTTPPFGTGLTGGFTYAIGT